MRPRAYQQLWQLAMELAPTSPMGARHGPTHTFDCTAAGIILRPEEGRQQYDCTPLNADTFAETGGDGVHFSLLLADDSRTIEDAPVVMTAPMAFERANVVVGESFLEFLALGCCYGYFALEQLAYDAERERTVTEIQALREPDPADPDARYLHAIIQRLGLRPWEDVQSRLEALERQYRPMIRLGPWVDEF